jgi:molybdopterin/thiamine biosynthesis adenylyltransferase
MVFGRQTDLFNPDNYNVKVEIIGAGAIGSFSALALAKMGIRDLKVWDADDIEPHNFPNQFYQLGFLHMNKVVALQETIMEFAGTKIEAIPHRFSKNDILSGDIIVITVDDMDVRKMIYLAAKNCPEVKTIIDARMGGEVMRVFTVDMKNPKETIYYEASLYSHAEATPVPCSARSIIYNVMVVSGLVANQVKKVIKGEKYGLEVIFDLKTMTFIVPKEG